MNFERFCVTQKYCGDLGGDYHLGRSEVAAATGVHRMTLSKIANHRGYNPTADVLDKLCNYFSCRIEQLVEHIPARQLKPVTTRRKKNASQRSK